jgi:hypothetical protein
MLARCWGGPIKLGAGSFLAGVSVPACSTGAAMSASSAPNRTSHQIVERYPLVTERVDNVGTNFVHGASALIGEHASGQEIYSKTVRPFVIVLTSVDTDRLALGAKGETKLDKLDELDSVDRETIRDLDGLAAVTAKGIDAGRRSSP